MPTLRYTADQAQPSFQRSAVIVAPRVHARDEGGERIGVRGVQFGAVESRFARARHRVAELLDDLVDVGEREHVDGLPPAGLCDFEKMNDLRHDLGIGAVVNAAHEVGQPRDIGILADAQQRAGLRVVDRHRLDHDQPHPAFRVADVAVGDRLVDETVLARQPCDHGRNHDPVRQNHPLDVERLEQFHPFAPRFFVLDSQRRRAGKSARATSARRRRP